MPRFVPPVDSLYHRYPQAQRRFTWNRVRTRAGIKVLPEERDQQGLPTCIYEAIMAWMQSHLRRQGITVRLSSRDLQDKEQALMGEELDRTVRCITVVTTEGILSEDDYQNQNLLGVKYVVDGCVSFFSLNKQAIEGAVEAMHRGPLLLVFHCGENYYEYVGKYKGKSILSYEKYVHETMLTHAVNSIGYGVEGFVPNWEFMNSYGKKLGPRGRVLPQNAIRLYGMDRVRPVVHEVPVHAVVVESKKRKREITEEVNDDEDDDDGEPPLKKPMLEKIDWMDLD